MTDYTIINSNLPSDELYKVHPNGDIEVSIPTSNDMFTVLIEGNTDSMFDAKFALFLIDLEIIITKLGIT
ncbi:hypothetical protein [Aestuariibaculum marinum]|uniref:Uncharacterized protein n=1 Tax=Aestuariibaculum marinum TaxID=2683592 RepID=A0A8J6PT60_9FLAO|nr:hypothetical protein [Aestuariibaculum marinum]MBD0822646.1 hypothetical protein [Aestuariibaculum marinum]